MTEPRDYLDEHLYDSLRWLLCSVTDWHIQHTIGHEGEKRFDGGPGYYVQVYAMNSAFVHARALLEFLTGAPGSENHLGTDLFGVERIYSELYCEDWRDPLNRYLMHLNERNKDGVVQYVSTDDDALHLKDMPLDIAREVVKLWREFISRLEDQDRSLAKLAQDKLGEGIDESGRVATNWFNNQFGITIAW
jgi:hypothetical protein